MINKDLESLEHLINKLNGTNSSLDKKDILSLYPHCKPLLHYTYNPFFQFGVTSKNCLKRNDLTSNECEYTNFIELLDDLRNRVITGHTAITQVNSFALKYSEHESTIWLIIDKNLKTRTDAKLINKVFPKCVPQFNVALANKYEEKHAKLLTFDGSMFSSRKLDGIRVIAMIDEQGDIKFCSRSGKDFTSLQKVREAIQVLGEKIDIKGKVFDGEMCIIDEDGNEDFTSIVSQISRKDYTIDSPQYKMFDCLTLEDFKNETSTDILSKRLENLQQLLTHNESSVLSQLTQTPLTSTEHFEELLAEAADKGWEGLILRKDTIYEAKRSNNMLKCKKMHDAEYIVNDIELGKKPMLNSKGLMEEQVIVASIKITHKGNTVSVGSGFSDKQRLHYRDNPGDIIGKTICVQYFEECSSKGGNISLRFPILKHIYEDGRKV